VKASAVTVHSNLAAVTVADIFAKKTFSILNVTLETHFHFDSLPNCQFDG
jgi:hypothetical protein